MRATKVITAAGVALVVAGAGAVWLVSRQDPAPPAAWGPAFATVTVHGRDGTFGSLEHTAPSGQSVAHVAVSGWDFAPGVQAYRTALAADGTVLVAGAAQNFDFTVATADRTTVAAYRPDDGSFATVQIGPVGPGAPSVADLAPVDGGVAFVTWPARGAASDRWPAFGVLSTVDGRWRVAPVGGAVPGSGFSGLATLPRSRHILAAQVGDEGEANGGLLALRLTGPDREGRFTAEVTARYPYPRVADGRVTIREVRADPTSGGRDERFAVGLDVDRGRDFAHRLVQEFRYDAEAGRIAPVSAPFVAGDRSGDRQEGAFFGYLSFVYDHAGNLWVSRAAGFGGGPLAVYTAAGGRRRFAAECGLRPGEKLDQLRAVAGGKSVWGRACPPDYDILQPRHLGVIVGLVEDAASKAVVALTYSGRLLAIRATPARDGLDFQIGNPVDLGRKLMPTAKGAIPWHVLGPVDGAHRAWVTGMQAAPDSKPGQHLDQWLYSVDLDDLFAPAAVELPLTPGRSVTIQAERSTTLTTTPRERSRRAGRQEVVSDLTVQACDAFPGGTTCGYDRTPGDGFVIADESRFGMLRDGADYRVDVPSAGDYRVSFRAATFPKTKTARIAMSAGGRRYEQRVSTGGPWQTVHVDKPVTLPAGPQVIRLSVPKGGGGWFLNSFTLQRV